MSFNNFEINWVTKEALLEADKNIFLNAFDEELLREKITLIALAQNCYALAMWTEKNPFKRAAIFGLFSGNSGVTLTLALQWWRQQEGQELTWTNIKQIQREIEKIQERRIEDVHYPFNDYYMKRMGDPEIPLSVQKDLEFYLFGIPYEVWED